LPEYTDRGGSIKFQPREGAEENIGRPNNVGLGRLVWMSAGINSTYDLYDLRAYRDIRHAIALHSGGEAILIKLTRGNSLLAFTSVHLTLCMNSMRVYANNDRDPRQPPV
jgi:hypothetical protein